MLFPPVSCAAVDGLTRTSIVASPSPLPCLEGSLLLTGGLPAAQQCLKGAFRAFFLSQSVRSTSLVG